MAAKTKKAERSSEANSLNAVFLRISEAVRSSGNLQTLFLSIHRILGELMPVKNFYFAFREKDDRGEEFITFPFFIDQFDQPPQGRIPLRNGLTGYVIRKGEPLLLDATKFKRLRDRGEIDRLLGTDSSIWLGVPLKVRDTVIGAVVVQSYDRADDYGEREKGILTLVSEQVAIAIELMRYRQSQEELVRQRTLELEEEKKVQSILFDISQAVYHAAGLKGFLETVHRRVGELMDARNFYVALYDKEVDKYTFPYFADEYDAAEELQPEDLHASLTDYVRRNGPLLADAAVHRRLIKNGQVQGVIGTDSLVWLGVPLLVPGEKEAIGVMTVQSYEDRRRYSEKEKRILMNISTTVALAIDRIRLVTDMIHHFNNAITGIKGYSEMLLDQQEKNIALLQRVHERLPVTQALRLDPPTAEAIADVREIIHLLLLESQIQGDRIGKIIEGIDQAAERVSKVFTPLLFSDGRKS